MGKWCTDESYTAERALYKKTPQPANNETTDQQIYRTAHSEAHKKLNTPKALNRQRYNKEGRHYV